MAQLWHLSRQGKECDIARDWGGRGAAAAAVFHNHCNGNFGIVIRGIVDKKRVVAFLPRQIFIADHPGQSLFCRDAPDLGCARLAGHLQIWADNALAIGGPIFGVGHGKHRPLHHLQMLGVHI